MTVNAKQIRAYHCISRNGNEYEYPCMSFHTIEWIRMEGIRIEGMHIGGIRMDIETIRTDRIYMLNGYVWDDAYTPTVFRRTLQRNVFREKQYKQVVAPLARLLSTSPHGFPEIKN